MDVIKKDGRREPFNRQKVINAVCKSADRVKAKLSDKDLDKICLLVEKQMANTKQDAIPVNDMHDFAEIALDSVNKRVAEAYREYRNYKKDFVHIMDDVLKESQAIRYIGDRDNANTDSALVATKRSLIYKKFSREVYQKIFLNEEEVQAIKTGYIYIHD